MSKNTWIVFIAIVFVMFGGLVFLSLKNNIDVSNITTNSIVPASSQSGGIGDHVLDTRDKKVILIEYGDFQCPGCGQAYQPIKIVTEKYKYKLTFIFRNFPITSLHPNARAAAAAAETAGLMGKYWQMHDKLYENQSAWENASGTDRTNLFAGYASDIGLDQTTFIKTLNDKNSEINKKINFDIALGKKDSVSGTPSFYLNGKPVDQYALNGKIVSSDTKGANPVWSDAITMDQLVIQPALKEAGIDTTSKK